MRRMACKEVFQPTDSLDEDTSFVVSETVPTNHTQDFLSVTFDKRYTIRPDTVVTDELLKQKIEDPDNDRKLCIFLNKDDNELVHAMYPGPGHSYIQGKQFELTDRKFGKGAFGRVQLIKDKTTEKTLIRKEIKKVSFKTKEIMVLRELIYIPQSPNIYGFMSHKENVSIFMQFVGYSFDKVRDIEDYRKRLTNNENHILEIAKQGFQILSTLRIKGIIHMDIKPENLSLRFLDEHFKLCFFDFGSCIRVPNFDRVSNFDLDAISGVTEDYMAPEICRWLLSQEPCNQVQWPEEDLVVTHQLDVYAFCLCLLYLKYWKHWPKVNKLNHQQKENIMFHIATKPSLVLNLIKEDWGEQLKKILRTGLIKTPNNRITPQQALEILNVSTGPVDIVGAVSSLNITDEPPERTTTDEEVVERPAEDSDEVPEEVPDQDQSNPGNLPFLPLLNEQVD